MGKIEEDLLRQMEEQRVKREEGAAKEADAKAHSWKGKLGILGALLFLGWKFKAIILIVLAKMKFLLLGVKFLGIGKIFISGGSMILSIAVYALQWGFPYALGFVLLIFIHEAGHVLALKRYNINASMPVFIPFVGAFVALKEMPKNVRIEAIVALAGPVLGTLGAFACHGIYMLTGKPLFLSLAFVGYMINLFNLMPILPLDGGRVMGALSPKLWIAGVFICIAFLIYHPNLILIILVVLSLPRLFSMFRQTPQEADYYSVPAGERLVFAILYFGLAAILGVLSMETHEALKVFLVSQRGFHT